MSHREYRATVQPGVNPGLRQRDGVTLLEILIALVTVGILTGIATSRLDWVDYRADSAARGALTELANAQRLAVFLQANVRVSIPDPTRMLVLEDLDDDGSVGTSERIRNLPLDNGFTFSKGTAGDTPSPADATTLTVLTFRRDGSANRSGTIYLAGPGTDATCKHCRAIAVTRATGRVVLYSHASGSWKRVK